MNHLRRLLIATAFALPLSVIRHEAVNIAPWMTWHRSSVIVGTGLAAAAFFLMVVICSANVALLGATPGRLIKWLASRIFSKFDYEYCIGLAIDDLMSEPLRERSQGSYSKAFWLAIEHYVRVWLLIAEQLSFLAVPTVVGYLVAIWL
jgi:hypothetical protein